MKLMYLRQVWTIDIELGPQLVISQKKLREQHKMIQKLHRIRERNPDLLHGTAMNNDYIVIIVSTQN